MIAQAFVINSDNIITNRIMVDDSADMPIPCILFKDVLGDPATGKYYDSDQNSVYWETSPVQGWILDSDTWEYKPPTEDPSTDLEYYQWNGPTESWVLFGQRDSAEAKWEEV